MGFFDRFRRRNAMRDPVALGGFVDEQAFLLAEKSVRDYSRLRAGGDADALFANPAFATALDKAQWEAYPRALAMAGEVIETMLRPHAGENAQAMASGLGAVILDAFDRRTAPPAIGEAGWRAARAELARSLADLARRRPATADTVADAHSSYYLAIMPIHEKLRGDDFPALRNRLKLMLAQIQTALAERADLPALAERLAAVPAAVAPDAPEAAP